MKTTQIPRCKELREARNIKAINREIEKTQAEMLGDVPDAHVRGAAL